MTSLELDEAEVTGLAPVDRWWSERSRKPLSIQRLLDAWEGLIESLETRTYEGIVYHYVHDLTNRDALRDLQACPHLPGTVAAKVEAVLEALDARFVKVTLGVENQRIETTFPAPELQEWWWDRTPAGLDGLIDRCL